jgi:hypothetical protein
MKDAAEAITKQDRKSNVSAVEPVVAINSRKS